MISFSYKMYLVSPPPLPFSNYMPKRMTVSILSFFTLYIVCAITALATIV